ncbi:MBOAT family protein [Acetobacter sp. TBRC 12305]|uniref:Probable alginate O-acetylase AlgI n=1 Tax=Acetobacter garciniae TaxID=2817435 RepID=A0A939HNG0_9PROT|nr:MBOAT family O-acyltransferase [Acetobacter garciniae]MBO1325506.1 MBOAT family protein [Acetobacter garciniae]MBX0345322.1 MBOAT family protein [Acetobacter garciniae]
MLFNSKIFLVYFLPVVLLGFVLLTRLGARRASVAWLSVASVVFYGWWNIQAVPLFMLSIIANFLMGKSLARTRSAWLLLVAVGVNLGVLGYYKYAGFVVSVAVDATGVDWTIPHIVLPLAISFFTFQQIAYLSDAYDGTAVQHSFLDYCLFISFFPHLIAGPITHHSEMLPQFNRLMSGRGEAGRAAVGMTLFLIGLFKKVILADPMGAYATPVFALAGAGHVPAMGAAWAGAGSYALQIYFDFSGYTDMAIGLGLLFGISLPPNFDSPFKSRNIIEFWSRWHMTLTRFLTAYIYNPLVLRLTRARAKKGLRLPRRGQHTLGTFATLVALPSLFTMFLSGLWHGAGWQFIVFGLLHGVYLSINHGWRSLKAALGYRIDGGWIAHAGSVLLTCLCVLVGLVFFRADSVSAARAILHGMVLGAPQGGGAIAVGLRQVMLIAVLLLVVWGLPNAGQWMRNFQTALNYRPARSWLERAWPSSAWRPGPVCGLVVGAVGMLAVMRALSAAPTEFLYFQF